MEKASPSKKVSSSNYKLFLDSMNDNESRQLKNIDRYIQNSKSKAVKLRMQMERILQEE